MKEIKVQTEDKNKEIIKSSVIKIDESSDKIKVVISVGERQIYISSFCTGLIDTIKLSLLG